jgi:hypothetical protein
MALFGLDPCATALLPRPSLGTPKGGQIAPDLQGAALVDQPDFKSILLSFFGVQDPARLPNRFFVIFLTAPPSNDLQTWEGFDFSGLLRIAYTAHRAKRWGPIVSLCAHLRRHCQGES